MFSQRLRHRDTAREYDVRIRYQFPVLNRPISRFGAAHRPISGGAGARGVLREAGLVEFRQEAQRRVYSLRIEPLAEIDEWLRLGGEFRARFFASGWDLAAKLSS